MSDAPSFTKMVPGFEFLQSLVSNASAALPNIGQWVAPTLNPEEIEKRIGELRTVQFWLEQNARMLGATIQALEVQRMTLSTLKSMNVQMSDLSESLKIRMPEPAPPPDDEEEEEIEAEEEVEEEEAEEEAPEPAAAPDARASADIPKLQVPPGVADPMQWWGALTKQFSELATTAMKDAQAGEFAASPVAKPAARAPAGQSPGQAAGRAAGKTAAKRPAAKKAAAKKSAARKRSAG